MTPSQMSESLSSELKSSPMMIQWQACKEQAPDALLLFRMGDFYESFHDDAVVLAKELDLTLTQRQGIPMSGVPCHTCELYVDKLVAKGYRVAIAEQIGNPKTAKGLVKREVVRIATPGTPIGSPLLSEKTAHFFASLIRSGPLFGLAFLDLTTGEFCVGESTEERELLDEIHRIQPAEFLTSERFHRDHESFFEEIRQTHSAPINLQADWHFEPQTSCSFLARHFNVRTLEGFGLGEMSAALCAAGALLRYLAEVLYLPLHHIQHLRAYSASRFMTLDRATQRNLELTASLRDGGRKNTLLDVLDQTHTPMGARLMHLWIRQPLLSATEIKRRQDGIGAFLKDECRLNTLRQGLAQVKDLERVMTRISTGYASPRDLMSLHRSFAPVEGLQALLSHFSDSWIAEQHAKLDPLPEMNRQIADALVAEPPLRIGEGRLFQDGFHPELDELRGISQDSKAWIARYQTELREETGIKTLKVGFNKMFGYYIEVSRGQSERMPPVFLRRQTLVNAERYTSPALKEYETKVLTAEERIAAIENSLFQELRAAVALHTKAVLEVARAIANIDCLSALAHAARECDYHRPIVDEGEHLVIEGGRHPVIERACKEEKFTPNDTRLGGPRQRLLLLTGPNMAGKSTYLRQVALIVIMAQIGSFVPASKALIGITDKVFTRIGASDDLSRGHSTFMIEMTETANILHNATPRSLVILDEIGRGTSTYDGISIAWSVAEYLLTHAAHAAKTLFATHYWELTQLEGCTEGAVNYHVAVHEAEDRITFLRKIVRGSTDKSYGIHVAQLAGLPSSVIQRSKEILTQLEETSERKSAFAPPAQKRRPPEKMTSNGSSPQLSLFGCDTTHFSSKS